MASSRTPAILLYAAAVAAGSPAATAGESYPAGNVTLLSLVPFDGFDPPASRGNDCWGYASPSGREYALYGAREFMAVVEVTDPAAPVVVAQIPHVNCTWSDVKTFGTYAYVVNDCSDGMDVLDLSDVDNGNVSVVAHLDEPGPQDVHNIALDTVSGFLYLCGGNAGSGRLHAYDLSDPANPAPAGQVASGVGTYCHDAQVVTYTSGPYAGQQIAFCANGGTGVDIYDVTDKSNMVRLSRSEYPNLTYAHQCWLSEDRQYLYVNDELDGINETVIFDVSDLSDPVLVNTYTSGLASTDHNLFVRDGYVYESDYNGGLRVYCAADPTSPVQVGFFDTRPESDGSGFDGAWGNYPFLPSGVVLVSDMNRGLFVLDVGAALNAGAVVFDYPDGRPGLVDPGGGTCVRVEIAGTCGGVAAPGSGLLHYDAGEGFVSVPMTEIADGVYDAVFPAVPCGVDVDYYVSAETTGGGFFTDPPGAPDAAYTATAAAGLLVDWQDDFETDTGWTTDVVGASSGWWQRGVPVDDPSWPYDPATDGDGSGQCWLTQNEPGDTDVDGGFVVLTSPTLDLSGGGRMISYEYFLKLTVANGFDGLRVEASGNGEPGPWIEVTRHVEDGGLDWHHHDITPQALEEAGVPLTASVKIRFSAGDGNPDSIVEAAVDGVTINELDCDGGVTGDLDGDGLVGITDFLLLLSAWGDCPDPCPPACPADLDADCTVGINDFLILLANWS